MWYINLDDMQKNNIVMMDNIKKNGISGFGNSTIFFLEDSKGLFTSRKKIMIKIMTMKCIIKPANGV